MRILGSPTVASKRWVYRQYDHMVRTNSLVLAGMGAGVVRVKGTKRALAMSTDGNGRYCYLNPRRGAMLALADRVGAEALVTGHYARVERDESGSLLARASSGASKPICAAPVGRYLTLICRLPPLRLRMD